MPFPQKQPLKIGVHVLSGGSRFLHGKSDPGDTTHAMQLPRHLLLLSAQQTEGAVLC